MTEDDAFADDDQDSHRLSEAECELVFGRLFPRGFVDPDILGEIAPEGWAKSSLVHVFHPTTEQLFEELIDFHRNMEELR